MSVASPYESGVRASRRAGARERGHRCSCELLLELCGREPVGSLLATHGIAVATLTSHFAALHREIHSEPADWRLRLAQRGGGRTPGERGDLEQLLAIVRTAESHAYQLLERVGIAGGALRRQVIEQIREIGPSLDRSPGRGGRGAGNGTGEPPEEEWSASTPPRPRRRSMTEPEEERAAARPVARPVDPAEGLPDRPLASMRARGSVNELASEARSTAGDASGRAPGRAEDPEGQAQDRASATPQEATERAPATSERRPRIQPLDPAELPPLIGREPLLARLADALLRSSPRPPLLVGAQGSGRTTVARHLARILPRPVFYLSAPTYDTEEALRADLKVIARAQGVVILDDLDRLVADAPPELLGVLSQLWTAGAPPTLTIVSHEGRSRLGAWLPGLAATLDVIELPELRAEALREAVQAAAPAILGSHGARLASGTHLGELTRLASDLLGGPLALPGRALDLLDLSCARVGRGGDPRAPQDMSLGPYEVSRELWIDLVCERTGLPRERVAGQSGQDLLDLEAELSRRVVGHEAAIHTLAQLIRRNRAGFASERPIASALLLGPSGVGKTELAKSLAAALFDRGDALVRLDMSEYAEAHAVARIVGAPPGYIGHEQGGALTDPLLRQPHTVLLLDEIEKAHRDVHQLLLQVFDEGRLTDGRGRTIDFRHALIIMTSNLGADRWATGGAERPELRLDEAAVLRAARAAFPTELWNRIEAPLVLHPLRRGDLTRICQRLAHASSARLFAERGIQYRLSEESCAYLIAACGDDASLGARPLRHLLAREVEPLIADAILRGRLRAGTQVDVVVEGETLALGRARRSGRSA